MADTLVAGSGVARRFQQGRSTIEALRPASFTVSSGDRIAIMGPSGSGKSTLLQLIADLDVPSDGAIRWPALGVSGALRPGCIGVVFQSASLLPSLSAVENVEVPPRLLGRDDVRDAALAALVAVGLGEVADKLPDELSGGQAQRVGIARAIASRPRLVLADERTGQLELFAGQRIARPDSVHMQVHVALDHAALPQDPNAAYPQALALVRNVELRVVGQAAIANNLAARLDGVRADALYARVLFLFLGAPGVVLAMLVTLAIATSGAGRRRWEQSLLRVRGASVATLVRLAAWEAGATGGVGVLVGLALGAVVLQQVWGVVDPMLAWPWFALAALTGLVLTGAAIVIPAWHAATRSTVAAGRLEHAAREAPLSAAPGSMSCARRRVAWASRWAARCQVEPSSTAQ